MKPGDKVEVLKTLWYPDGQFWTKGYEFVRDQPWTGEATVRVKALTGLFAGQEILFGRDSVRFES